MKIFDLHCDTINSCLDTKQALYLNTCHIDLQRATTIKTWIQTFAFWIDSKYKGESAWDRFISQYELFRLELEKNKSNMSAFIDERSVKENHCNYLLSIEGGSMLNGDLSRIDFLEEIGIKIFTLTWNGESQLGFGADTKSKKPLTPFGIDVLKRLEQKSITVDVSHLNKAGFYSVVDNSEKPFIASHSNAKSVCNHFRNLDNEQIEVILQKKGLIGLNFHKPFLNENVEKSTSIDDILVHTEHFLSLGCENILSIGSDFDGAKISGEIKDIKGLENIYDNMIKYFSKDIVDKIFYENAVKFFTRGSQGK